MPVSISDRFSKLPPYPFAALRQKIREAQAAGREIITLGIGDPDLPTPAPIVDEMCRAVRDESDPDRHRYGCDRPVEELPEAAREFYRHRYGVKLGADQVVTTMGSKDAIAKLPLGVLNAGDMAIAPEPGYPTYNIGSVCADSVTYRVPLRAENGFLVDFDEIPDEVRRLAKILWLNYPNNPTTATAPLEFFERAVAFGRAHEILIAHDAAYSENTYEGYEAPSILQVEGADEVAVEFFSLSKAFCMTGWRVGFVAGNAPAVAALGNVKSNTDNGTLRAVQFAAAKALSMADTVVPPLNAVYQRRRDMVVDTLNANGWQIEKPKATIYVWAPVPEQYSGSSAAFAEDLFEKAGVVVTPGRAYGQGGEGFFRISLTYPDEVLEEALERMAGFGG
jgi:LL-diaminopimelate aminotransferase